jgi:hypothetical protein
MDTSAIRTRPPGAVSGAALLETWSTHPWREGLRVNDLAAFDRLTIETLHSTYEIVIVSPQTATILVRGGAFFPHFTRVRVAGSSLGGSFLKLHGIYVGFRLELAAGPRSIVTSTVRNISLASGPTSAVM